MLFRSTQQRIDRSRWILNQPINQVLIRLTWPMLPAIIAIMALDLFDTFLVSRLGTESLAALSFTIPITSSLFALAIGFSIATSAILCRTLGRGEHSNAKRVTTDSLLLACLLAIIVGVLGSLTIQPLFSYLGANHALIPESFHLGPKPNIMPIISDYMTLRYLGFVFMLIPIMTNSVMRATGDSLFAGRLMFYWACLTALIDSYLMLVLESSSSLASIGWGHLIADAVISFLSLFLLIKHEKLIDLKIPNLHQFKISCVEILRIGLPATAMSLLVPVALTIVTSWVAFYGRESVAAFGVILRIESLALFIPMALSTALPVFIGQNFAANCIQRCSSAFEKSLYLILIAQLSVYVLLISIAAPIAELFSQSKIVSDMIVNLLWFLPLSYSGQGMVIIAISTLNALHRPNEAFLLSSIRMFGLFIPATYLGAYWAGLNGLFIGLFIANIIVGLVAFIWMRNRLKSADSSISKYASIEAKLQKEQI